MNKDKVEIIGTFTGDSVTVVFDRTIAIAVATVEGRKGDYHAE